MSVCVTAYRALVGQLSHISIIFNTDLTLDKLIFNNSEYISFVERVYYGFEICVTTFEVK